MRSKALPGWVHTLCTAAAALVFLTGLWEWFRM